MAIAPPSRRPRQDEDAPSSLSSSVGLNITNLEDIVADNRSMYNVMGRVNFVSLGGFSEQGEYMITAELLDESIVVPMKLVVLGRQNVHLVRRLSVNDVAKIRNICATDLAREVTLVADGSRPLAMNSMNTRAPECRALPEAHTPIILPLSKALQENVPTANLFVRVRTVLENAISVINHAGAEGLFTFTNKCDTAPSFPTCCFVCIGSFSRTAVPSCSPATRWKRYLSKCLMRSADARLGHLLRTNRPRMHCNHIEVRK